MPDRARDHEPAAAELATRLRDTIEATGPLRFDAFLEAVHYDPNNGYYGGSSTPRAGPEGDFVTAPTLTPFMGASLAQHVREAWVRLGHPEAWFYIEVGAGTGGLSAPLLETLHRRHPETTAGMYAALIDRNPAHRDAAKQRLGDIVRHPRLIVDEHLPDVQGAPVILLANELLDDLPVRLMEQTEGTWFERFVGWTEHEGFVWVQREADEELLAWVEGFGIKCPDHHTIEVPVGAHQWLEEITEHLDPCAVHLLLIDYGLTALELLSEPRPDGTLTTFFGHAQGRDILSEPGTRNITHQVNWTAIERHARGLGWAQRGFTTQGMMLMGLGFAHQAARVGSQATSVDDLANLQAMKEILLPGGMGERVKALVLERNIVETKTLPPLSAFQNLRPIDPQPRG